MRKIVIKIFCRVICIVLSLILFWVSCNSCKKHYDVSTTTKESPKKKSKKGRSASSKKDNKDNKSKLHLKTKVLDPDAKNRQFLVYSIHPPVANTNLKQYKVVASAIKGKGQLLAATHKEKGRFQYELPLGPKCQPVPVSSICFMGQSAEERLKNGELIEFRCLYKPVVGSKKGEEHHLNLTIFYYDQQDRLVEKNEIIAEITIKDDILGQEAVKQKRKRNNTPKG